MMKKKKTFANEMRNKRGLRIQSTPFLNLIESKTDILNHEIFSLISLTKIVKSYQVDFLTPKNENKYEYDFVINSLKNFKNTLNNSLKSQIEERNYLLSKVNLLYFKYIIQKEETITNFDNNSKDKINEIEQLNNLNFTIKNEITKIDDINKKIKEDIYLLKKIDYFQEETKEMICKNKKEISLAENYLKLQLENLQEEYNRIYNINEEKEEEIDELNSQLDKIRSILLNEKFDKKYIDTEMIIEEVSENNYSSFFINNSNRNDSKNFDDSYKEKNNTPHIKKIIKYSDNLNMNINLNINLRNPVRKLSSQESKKKNDFNTIPKPIKYRAKSSNSLGNLINKKK